MGNVAPSRNPQSKLRLVAPSPSAPAVPAPSPALDDAQLIAAIRADDELAATAFHDRLYPCVNRTILRLLGRRDADYEDIVQLSMVELIQSFDRYRGECSLESWASTIASRAVYNHLRRRKLHWFRRWRSRSGPHEPWPRPFRAQLHAAGEAAPGRDSS